MYCVILLFYTRLENTSILTFEFFSHSVFLKFPIQLSDDKSTVGMIKYSIYTPLHNIAFAQASKILRILFKLDNGHILIWNNFIVTCANHS